MFGEHSAWETRVRFRENVMPGAVVRYVYNTQPVWEETT